MSETQIGEINSKGEEGATSQGIQVAIEASRGKKMDSPCKAARKNLALLTPWL